MAQSSLPTELTDNNGSGVETASSPNLVLQQSPSTLNDAAWFGDLAKVTSLLEANRNNRVWLNAFTHDWTALMAAASNGHEPIVRILLDAGASANKQDSSGLTALIWAAVYGHVSVAELLLQRGADPNVCDKGTIETISSGLSPTFLQGGKTALMYAAFYGHDSTARVLLDRGAMTKTRSKTGATALHWAAQKDNTSMVKLLLSRGADTSARNKAGETAEQKAVSDAVRILLRNHDKLTKIDSAPNSSPPPSARDEMEHRLKRLKREIGDH